MLTMYKDNSRGSRKFKGLSPLWLSCNLTGKCHPSRLQFLYSPLPYILMMKTNQHEYMTHKSQILCFLFTLFLIAPINSFTQDNELIGRQELINDAQQMLSLLENVHPQPYFAGGGKIAFHQRFQNLLKAIPKNGMTREDFRGLLSPFLALVGDGHTHVYPDSPFDFSGLPLLFYVVEKDLYVAGVIDKEHRNLFGARLLSVEGVPFSEIVRRTQQYYSADNIYGTLAVLGNFEHLLTKRAVLEDIVHEWKGSY